MGLSAKEQADTDENIGWRKRTGIKPLHRQWRGILNYFTPEALRDSPDTAHRARLVTGLAMLGGVFGVVYAIFYLAIGHIWGAAVIAVCDLAMISVPFLMRKTARLGLASNLHALIWTAGFCALSSIEGGVRGHAIAWLAAGIPIFALLLIKRRMALIWCSICTAATFFFCWLEVSHVTLPLAYPERWHPIVTLAGYVGLAVFASLLGLIFGYSRRHAYRRFHLAVADLMKSNERCRKSEARFRELFEGSPEAIFVEDFDGLVLDANPAACRLRGLPRNELVGKHTLNLTPTGLWREIPPFEHGEIRSNETYNLMTDEKAVPVSVSVSSIQYGSKPALLVHARDMTEFNQLQQQFLQSQKMDAIGQLAGGIAHDFNNLLTAILGYNESIAGKLGVHHPLHKDAMEIERAAQRAATLTHQLLAFSRKQTLQPRVFDLNIVIANIHKLLRRLIGEHIELVTILDPFLDSVKADAGQIEQVIVNLVVNARDAMQKGGTLTIRTTNIVIDGTPVEERAHIPEGSYVVLSVSDVGVGMEKAVLEHVFEPFFTTKEEGKGTGLGLATCYGIVKQSGGYIRVTSDLGMGSTFEILLPAVAELPERPEVPAFSGGRHQGDDKPCSETILVVEDRAEVRALATSALEAQGYTILEAENGEDALRVLAENGGLWIDLLMTDVVMPRMGGKEFAERFHRIFPESRVLFTSGSERDQEISTALEEGWAEFLQKPFTTAVLIQKVREVLECAGQPV